MGKSPLGGLCQMRNLACVVAAIALVLACISAHSAQYVIPVVRNVEAKSGIAVLLADFFDCRSHVPYNGTAFVQHGKVTMKSLTINKCGNLKELASAYWYTSDPRFKGVDEVNFSYVSGSALIVHVTVR
jgi:hypothetical protein